MRKITLCAQKDGAQKDGFQKDGIQKDCIWKSCVRKDGIQKGCAWKDYVQEDCDRKAIREKQLHKQLYQQSRSLTGPVLHSFVSWILEEAQKRGIHTLYFLARDGYVLQKIARMLCRERGLAIQCRYLYCSRASLRMPSYHLIGEEALDLIFSGGYYVTPERFLERAGIPAAYWEQVMSEAGIRPVPSGQCIQQSKACLQKNSRRTLGWLQIQRYRSRIARSKTFQKCLQEHSRQSYKTAIGYLRQAGLLAQTHIGIVDSGWTGSMQRSLRQLLEAEGFRGQMTGFYFGLYQNPKEQRDGEYLSWYFSPKMKKRRQLFFCNNLLECFLSAPHGMTVDYKLRQGRYEPVLEHTEQGTPIPWIRTQLRGILDGAAMQEKAGKAYTLKQCARILGRLMAAPTSKEARVYGNFLFCDDITEGYLYPLAEVGQEKLLREHLLAVRLWNRRRKQKPMPLFWPFGTIALVRAPLKRSIYWLDACLAQWIRTYLL